jgi:hypothetical protein
MCLSLVIIKYNVLTAKIAIILQISTTEHADLSLFRLYIYYKVGTDFSLFCNWIWMLLKKNSIFAVDNETENNEEIIIANSYRTAGADF